MTRHRRRRRTEGGAVTAELALGLPLVLSLTIGLVWLLAVAAAQVRVVDAARESARVIARGDDEAAARTVASRIAPAGSSVEIEVAGGRVTVTSSAEIDGPGGLFAFLPGVRVRSSAVAVMELP